MAFGLQIPNAMNTRILIPSFLLVIFATSVYAEENPNLSKPFANSYAGDDVNVTSAYSTYDARFEKVFGKKDSVCGPGFVLETADLSTVSVGDSLFTSFHGQVYRCRSSDPALKSSANPCRPGFKLLTTTNQCTNAGRPFSYYECGDTGHAWRNYIGDKDPCPRKREPVADDEYQDGEANR